MPSESNENTQKQGGPASKKSRTSKVVLMFDSNIEEATTKELENVFKKMAENREIYKSYIKRLENDLDDAREEIANMKKEYESKIEELQSVNICFTCKKPLYHIQYCSKVCFQNDPLNSTV